MSTVPYTITQKTITVVVGNKVRTVHSSAGNFNMLKDHLRLKAHNSVYLEEILDLKSFIAKATFGRVQISDDKVRVGGKEVNSVVAERILALMAEGFDVEPMSNFLDRLTNNPLESSQAELLLWLEAGAMPITSDGCFLAFKAVRNDFMDKYSGRFDNSVGKIVQMTREAVDPDRRNECSTGLHFCSPGYLSGFASPTDPIMIVKIDPADVVAIPADYQNQKGRTWRYEVVGQVPPNEVAMTFFGGKALVDSYQSAVVGNDDTYDSVTDGKWDACNAMEEDYEDVVDEDDVTNHNGITDNIFEGLSQVADSSTVMNKAIALPVVKAIKTVVTVPTTPTKTTARVFKTTAGVEFTAKQIKKAWKEAGSMRGGAKLIGVSKSTFAGWIASL